MGALSVLVLGGTGFAGRAIVSTLLDAGHEPTLFNRGRNAIFPGVEVVHASLESDPGARHLGEVSLVDRGSRIAKAGIVFHNTLFDENAGCHVAWGQSFPFAVPGGLGMTPDQRFELGLNNSGVHTDVVIGGEGITVTGRGRSGSVEIIREDEWVL